MSKARGEAAISGRCGVPTRAAFPEAVSAPVQYGPRIAAFVVYLSHYQFLPEQRLAALMSDLFGVGFFQKSAYLLAFRRAH